MHGVRPPTGDGCITTAGRGVRRDAGHVPMHLHLTQHHFTEEAPMGVFDKDNDGMIRDDAQRAADKAANKTGSAADNALRLHHDERATTGDVIGEGVGGFSGVAAGAAIGAIGGPIGSVIGMIAGAAAGWWTGRAVSEAAASFTNDEDHFRQHYSSASAHATGSGTDAYDRVRPAYQLGHIAGRNPDYANRSFEEVETDLQRGWSSDVSSQHGDWQSVRGYAREAYTRGRMGSGAAGLGAAGAAGHAAGHTSGSVGDTIENAWDRTKAGVRNLADRTEDKLDDTKDRVDGNPASRPGVDRTDDLDRRI
jgi:hypothetical protein